ncbi:phosphatase PAP2 family protein, partial [Halorubrum sp. SS5]
MTGIVAADRGLGETAVVDALPEFVVVLFAAVTHLADPWFLFALLAVGYWFASEGVAGSPRRAGATAIAAVTCAYAATALGKAWFAAPRPPGAMPPADVPGWLPALLTGWYEAQVLSDGFGFPSGHATGGAAAYLALALLYDRLWTDRARYIAAGAVAVAVAASRVVIEVHFLVDVLAGLAVGAGTVAVALWLAGDPRVRRSASAATRCCSSTPT